MTMNDKPLDTVVNELCASGRGAYAYFADQLGGKFVEARVLERGSTDFDVLFGNEPANYKVQAYIHYYMKKHYHDNQKAFNAFAHALINFQTYDNAVFFDFGCGPMTSGIALLKKLEKLNADETIFYCGMDKSHQMCEAAREINHNYALFNNAQFFTTVDDAAVAVKKFLFHRTSTNVFVNFSYVLSEKTYKDNDIDDLTFAIYDIVAHASVGSIGITIFYHNPFRAEKDKEQYEKMHGNWEKMKRTLGKKCHCIGSSVVDRNIYYEALNVIPSSSPDDLDA